MSMASADIAPFLLLALALPLSSACTCPEDKRVVQETTKHYHIPDNETSDKYVDTLCKEVVDDLKEQCRKHCTGLLYSCAASLRGVVGNSEVTGYGHPGSYYDVGIRCYREASCHCEPARLAAGGGDAPLPPKR